jgi:hypothetical protein
MPEVLAKQIQFQKEQAMIPGFRQRYHLPEKQNLSLPEQV